MKDEQFYSDRREIVDPPVKGFPIEERPITLVYNNEHPYALAELRIFGQPLNPANYTIDAEKGLITLSYHFYQVNMKVDNETS